MSAESTIAGCPKCGAAVPDSAAEGLCTRCLLAAAAAPTEAGQPSGTRPTVPPLERIAAAFPQLEILELIGAGGMGAVFKARQPKLDRYVALKVLPEALARDPAFAERFQREGRVLARLNHPNIVTVHDFGQSGDFFYLMMEYVDGVNLRQAMRAGRFTPAQALALVPRICEALQFAHDEGVLHRDIKPENILLDARGRVKIADFGIAKLLGETRADVSLTATGAAIGTPQYMAPEQIERPADVDHRADIYSLGVVFYELLTGELPLGRFAPPSAKTDLDARIDEIVLRALTKERELRQQSAREVKTEIEGVTARGDVPSSSPPSLTESTHVAPLWQLSLFAREAIRTLLIVMVGCLLYALVLQWAPWQRMIVWYFAQGWLPAVAVGAGMAAVIWLGTLCWRRRAAWVSPLRLPLSADVTNRWLQALLGSLLVGVGVNFVQIVLVEVGSLGQMLANGELGRAGSAFATRLCTLMVVWLLVRRELKRTNLTVPGPLPAWAHRVAAGLAVVALAFTTSLLVASRTEYVIVGGLAGFLALISVALWTGSRVWRAAALALNAWILLLAFPGAAALLAGVFAEPSILFYSGVYLPLGRLLAAYPLLRALCQLLAMLATVAGLVTLIHPGVRAAFGLPPRRRSRMSAVAPPLTSKA
jgi:serine/threonine protein kinase